MLKKAILQSLSPERADRLRIAKKHFEGFVSALFHGPASETITARTLFQREGESFLKLAKSCPANPADHEHETVKRTLMERVGFDERYKSLLRTPHLKSLIR